MKGRKIVAAVFLLPASAAGCMTWFMWRTGEDGKWLFGVFAVFFLLLAITPILPELKRRAEPGPTTSTRFGPHWFMLLAVLIIVTAVLAAILGAVLRR